MSTIFGNPVLEPAMVVDSERVRGDIVATTVRVYSTSADPTERVGNYLSAWCEIDPYRYRSTHQVVTATGLSGRAVRETLAGLAGRGAVQRRAGAWRLADAQ